MLRSDELKQEIASKESEIGHFRMMGDYNNRLRAEAELQTMREALETVTNKEREELRSFASAIRSSAPTGGTVIHGAGGYSPSETARLRNRGFNKLVLAGARGTPANLTPDERDAYYNISGSPGSPGQLEAVPSSP